MKRVLIAVAVLVVVLGGGVALWARSALTGEAVRAAVARQLSSALGAPVTIGGLSASVFPRVSIDLADVTIGQPASVTVKRLRFGTALGALFSRRIEQASVQVEGARLQLPLGLVVAGGPGEPGATTGTGEAAAVTLVSVDEIALSDVEIVSGGRTLRSDARLRWQDGRLAVEDATLTAGDARIAISGVVTDLNGPVADLKVRTPALDVLELVDFFAAFAAGAAPTAADGGPPAGTPASTSGAAPSAMAVTLDLEAGRAGFGALAIERLTATARASGAAIRMDPVKFSVFGGSLEGALAFALDGSSRLDLDATVSGLDVATAMAFAGSPDTLTGRASGRVAIQATGVSAAEVMRTAAGTARLDVSDGSVRGLGLVRQAVLVGSMQKASQAQALTPGSERFSKLGLTAQIARGEARTSDLQFESPDVLMRAGGVVHLATTVVDLAGQVQLSNELSKQAGRDLVRYTQQDGRVTLPVTVSGPASALSVSIDMADAAKRAVTNRATEEAKKALSKSLRRIIR